MVARVVRVIPAARGRPMLLVVLQELSKSADGDFVDVEAKRAHLGGEIAGHAVVAHELAAGDDARRTTVRVAVGAAVLGQIGAARARHVASAAAARSRPAVAQRTAGRARRVSTASGSAR